MRVQGYSNPFRYKSLFKIYLSQNLWEKDSMRKNSTLGRARQKANYNEFRHTRGLFPPIRNHKNRFATFYVDNESTTCYRVLNMINNHLWIKDLIFEKNMVPKKPDRPQDCHSKQVLSSTNLLRIHPQTKSPEMPDTNHRISNCNSQQTMNSNPTEPKTAV